MKEFLDFIATIRISPDDPAVIFAGGVFTGLLVYLIIKKMKKIIIFMLVLLTLVLGIIVLSDKRASEISLDAKGVEEVGDAARVQMKKKLYQTLPGMQDATDKNKKAPR